MPDYDAIIADIGAYLTELYPNQPAMPADTLTAEEWVEMGAAEAAANQIANQTNQTKEQ